jgi:glycolate oxidase FAD binding subunit
MSVASTADPSTAAEAAEALRAAAVAGQRVRIVGNGTKLAWGNAIASPDVELRTTSMTDVVAHNAGDFTAIVQPGLPFATLQRELAGKGQMLAIDPPAQDATVGGVIATADSGPLRHRYHAPRDLVIGVQLALADGSVARAGGTVIKNVAGYDLSKLFTGSFGTLGLIAEVALRLHPLPQNTATAIGRSDDPARLAAAAAACAREPLEADACDVGWDAEGGAILVRLSGDTATDRVARTLPLLADAGLLTSVEHDDEPIWARQREGQRSPEGVAVKVSATPAALRSVLEAARDLGATLVGRAALGLSWLRLDGLSDGDAAAKVAALRERLAPASVTLLDAPAAVRGAVDPWGPVDPGRLALMRSVKARFDPTGALAPGLFVGGL